jgi:hypothetical protein
MIRYRYPLDGPEPPATVREVAIGPGSWGPHPYPRGSFAYLAPWYGYVWRRVPCPQRRCDEHCYHWSNGDRRRPWTMLRSRARWAEARDTAALSALHARYHARQRRR